jgi:polar amino acid transport system substrate-binding protein
MRAAGGALLMGMVLAASGASGADGSSAAKELAPTGVLRVGVVEAPNAGAFFVSKERGTPRGVTVDLGAALGERLGMPVEYRVYPNSGECTEATSSGAIDVSFMPVDDERRAKVAFGPAYYLLESTYLVTGPSGVQSLAGVDRAGVRVVGIANTTTIRAAGRTLKNTTPIAARSVDEALEMLRSGRADALALSRDSLKPFLAVLPGSRIVDGGFQQTSISIAVPKDRPAALAYATAFLDEAKASGVVRKAFDKAGLQQEPVAPAGR